MGRLKPRPSVRLPRNSSSVCVSPHSATSIELLGGVTRNGVTVSKGEFELELPTPPTPTRLRSSPCVTSTFVRATSTTWGTARTSWRAHPSVWCPWLRGLHWDKTCEVIDA